MAFNRDNYKKVKRAFEEKERAAKDTADAKKRALGAQYPDIAAVDRELSQTSMLIMREISQGPDRIVERIDELRRSNLALQKVREELLISHGYPANYTDPAYECEICHDTGYLADGSMCSCFKRAMVLAGYESSGIGRLLQTQSFESFKVEYYSDDARSFENMKRVFALCRAYADSFTAGAGNLLLCGKTGLGKTHISTSIAKVVIERGYDVVYDTAQNIFRDFEREKFERSYSSQESAAPSTDRYFACDLLIIDDLGTEMSNTFTVSCLYNMINSRMIAGKSMIINTNLNQDELMKRYSDRITSRLFGEFSPLLFSGVDVRQKKLGF
ncbi:MAG: ATP-binding protein [Clostridia bacterium]|nr:ATP-binding protein [Clostridia bacterium]